MRYVDTLRGDDAFLADWLTTGFAAAARACVRTGFLSSPAVSDLEQSLLSFLKRGGELLIVAGGAIDQAEPKALIRLADLLAPYPLAALDVVIAPEEFQNAKTYYFGFPDGHSEALIGSPNLTLGGLSRNHEAALLLDSRNSSEAGVIGELLDGIEQYRNRSGTTPLTDEVRVLLSARQGPPSPWRREARSRMGRSLRLDELLSTSMDRLDEVASGGGGGLPSGFSELDEITGGLRQGDLTVIGGRPGVGSSTLLLDMVRNCAVRYKKRAALYTMDRASKDVVEQVLSADAKIKRADMRSGRMSDDDWRRLAERMTEIADAPLLINSTPGATMSALCDQIAKDHAEEPLQLIAIDPLNMIDPMLSNDASRERQVSHVVRRLKVLALELDVPVLATAELGRSVDQRADRRPNLGDFRDSDTISQVADNVILLYRPDAFDRDDPRAGEADLMLVKHRNGPTKTVTVAHQLHLSRFVDMAH